MTRSVSFFQVLPSFLSSQIKRRPRFICVPLWKRVIIISFIHRVNFLVLRYRNLIDLITIKEVFVDEVYFCSDAYFAALNKCYLDSYLAGKVPLILDCGAHAGYFHAWSNLVWPLARVISFEMDESNWDILRINILSNDVVHAAVHYKDVDQVRYNENFDSNAHSLQNTQGAFDDVTVKCVNAIDVIGYISRLEDENQALDLFLLKIDVEGFEGELLPNLDNEWLRRWNSIVVEVHDWIHSGVARSVVKSISFDNNTTFFRNDCIFQVKNNVNESI